MNNSNNNKPKLSTITITNRYQLLLIKFQLNFKVRLGPTTTTRTTKNNVYNNNNNTKTTLLSCDTIELDLVVHIFWSQILFMFL